MASKNKRKEQECKYREKIHKYTKYAQVHLQSVTEMNKDSITIIIMNSNQKHDMISLSWVLMNNRVEEEKNMMIMTNR